MKKFLLLFLAIFLIQTSARAACIINPITKVLNENNITRKTIVSISIKDIKTGKTLYQRDENKLLNPASTLKIFTTSPALDVLGPDYTFDTSVYKDSSNNLYIKLGADPLLTSDDLKFFAKDLKTKLKGARIKNIYFDDSIIDKINWPKGWMWDDNTNPYTPYISAYNIDKNQVRIKLLVSGDRKSVLFSKPEGYGISIINKLSVSNTNDYKISRENGPNIDIITLEGTLAKDEWVSIPVSSPRILFITKLEEAFNKEGLDMNGNYKNQKVPTNVKFVAKISRPIDSVLQDVLKNSNNLSSETLFKVAGGKYKNTQGSTDLGLVLLRDFYTKKQVLLDEVKIVDASGVSRSNLLNTDWITSSLCVLSPFIKQYLAQSGEGTLSARLGHLKGSVWAKTGSLDGVSAISGYVTTIKGQELAFAIIIQNYNEKPSIVKSFEDDLIDAIYNLQP